MDNTASNDFDTSGAVLVGSRPAPAVTRAWTAIATGARCDPPAPPRVVANRHDDRPEVHRDRGSWFPGMMDPEMFEGSPCGIVLTTQMGYIIDANPAFLAITGRPWTQLSESHIHSALGLAARADLIPLASLSKGSIQFERTCRHHSGRALQLEITVVPISDADGGLRTLSFHIIDVTGQRVAEQATADSLI